MESYGSHSVPVRNWHFQHGCRGHPCCKQHAAILCIREGSLKERSEMSGTRAHLLRLARWLRRMSQRRRNSVVRL